MRRSSGLRSKNAWKIFYDELYGLEMVFWREGRGRDEKEVHISTRMDGWVVSRTYVH